MPYRTGRTLALAWALATLAAHGAELPAPMLSWLARQSGVTAWSADFVQTRQLRTLARPLVSTGRVWFAAPARVRWEIGVPPRTIAVRGDSDFVVAYPELRRAERFPAEGAGPWKDAVALLEGGFLHSAAEFQRRFELVSSGSTNGVFTAHLQPRSASTRRMMPRFVLSFDERDHELRATELGLMDGSVLRNEFSHGRTNPKLDPALFHSPVGPDYKVTEPGRR